VISREAIRRHLPVRRYDAGELLESFFVTAVVTVLFTRFLLRVTGYPQLGGDKLHIAHLLWGGMFMLLALVTNFSALSRLPLRVASVLGGIGFGLFIDELGKFITRDVDYFYQPAVMLIYLVFVALYLAIQALGRRVEPSPQDCLVNALELTKEAVIRDLDEVEKRHALELLAKCDPADPLVRALQAMLVEFETVPPALPDPWARLRRSAGALYERWLGTRWFLPVFAVFTGIASLVGVLEGTREIRPVDRQLSVTAWGQLLSSTVLALLALTGLALLRTNRLAALRMLRSAVLVSIFVVQVLSFYREQLQAIAGLAVSLLVWAALGVMMRREQAAYRPAAPIIISGTPKAKPSPTTTAR
jgi:hypothetical protein